MGWQSTVRSMNAAAKRSVRAAEKRQRELERQRTAAAKAAAAEQAALDVSLFENRIELLTSVHRVEAAVFDWQSMSREDRPSGPEESHAREDKARAKLAAHKAGVMSRLLGREQRLKDRIEAATKEDARNNADALSRYEVDRDNWEKRVALAKGVLERRPAYLKTAIDWANRFEDIEELGSSVAVTVDESGQVTARVHVNGEEVVPTETKTQLQSGKLSTKKMPQGKYFELYQDYVCGCALRVANDLLGLIPVDAVVVNVSTPILNSSTGHFEDAVIVSALIPRKTLSSVNLMLVDASDCLTGNFVHNMAFKKTQGFGVVDALTFEDFDLSQVSP